MDKLHEQVLLLLQIPIYAILIPLEIIVSHIHDWKFYSWKETAVNIYLTLVNAGIDLLLRAFAFGVLIFFYQFHVSTQWSNPVVYWLCLFLCEDVLFWLEHYVDHHVRLFWAVHVTHHSSEEFNLTTGVRSSVFMPFYRYMYFIPLALLGFEPLDIFFMYAFTQTYGILVHTQFVRKMPRWVEFIFVTPSHHRVHHASNTPYLDKNMGMVLIVWDRLFGTFAKELPEEPPRYGLVKNLPDPHHPVRIVFHEWKAIGQDLRKPVSIKNKIKYLFKSPGWSHDGSTLTAHQMRVQWRKDKGAQKTKTPQNRLLMVKPEKQLQD